MPVVRFSSGEESPWETTYALVGHYGEATGLAVWCCKGDRLPLLVSGDVEGPLWFVPVEEAEESAEAA